MAQQGEIISNKAFGGGYFKVDFFAPEICKETAPGQFVHVRIANLRDRILRRPFSICDVGSELLSVVYKKVGEGTKVLAELKPGSVCDLLGPLGHGFSLPVNNELPVIVAGGYGAAATLMLAKKSPVKGILLLGARDKADILLVDEFEKSGFEVRCATESGSVGRQGMVTDLVEDVLSEKKEALQFYACGPLGMLEALAMMLMPQYGNAQLSLDHLMCCGVGACFACVVKVNADNNQGWRYARSCKEGPVFTAREMYLGEVL